MGMGKINLSKSTFLILFLAVGFFVGISFSSVYAGIPWGTSEIADNAITSKKIKNFQVKTNDIKGNAIKSNKIKDGTILFADIRQNKCAFNERMAWSGTAWICAEFDKVITSGDCLAPPGPGVNWSGCVFTDLDLDNQDMTGAILVGTVFDGFSTHFFETNFNGADFRYTVFKDRIVMNENDFTNADFSHSKTVGDYDIKDNDFTNADLSFADFSINSGINSGEFGNNIITGVQLEGTKLACNSRGGSCGTIFLSSANGVDDLDFSGQNLRNVDFSGVRFNSPVNFDGADLEGSNFHNADFSRESLSAVGANFKNAELVFADFGGTANQIPNFEKALLSNANLAGALLQFANMREVVAPGANFMSAILDNAQLQEADLRGADLRHASLVNAGVLGTRLRLADLTFTDFTGVPLNQLGDGFDCFGIERCFPFDILSDEYFMESDLTVTGTISAGDLQYRDTQTREVTISPAHLFGHPATDYEVSPLGASTFIKTGPGTNRLFGIVPNLPDGATITKFECVIEDSGAGTVTCLLIRSEFAANPGQVMAQMVSNNVGVETLSTTTITDPLVDTGNFGYYVRYSVSDNSCDNSCKIRAFKVIYTVGNPD